ncbi:hypothetical protein AEL96_03580 [Lactobacillus crispatus]|uniref:hypothetical protein n=1 Tax=Lactobacillus crispatus TaxID=47770 RepID=UPI000762062B|nr:hypothetical protein [Lactobacillus crispatus]KWU06439.1 hypothetical protein AEL96_03580 [Lactobacillus crispatus]
MKTKLTKQMEQALVADALHKRKHPALEVCYWHTEPNCGAKLKPIDEITLLCNVCNRFWFSHHLQEKRTEDW